ncbi:trypsin-like peptidase domain-containing protein [Streptomyces sp. VRA16 Mangrove soil]|uniref:trypsin-like peptidase domain-containing protein n=1 Tax=Streptomyces sp. VRA16 Mangrove soil TaxID=2817434 RepID=UPI001A9E186D|nr:trypsin-like peptidase domain-containing protein [Streptomyces sp. VRA16 Mangrove soil]MBO1337043.1 trypsin-like peptidase domain-containing protein [Streptomyces sp. VRA16 Mangrove soil]
MDADEGKPTKGEWWSRPRPSAGRSDSEGDDGDWHLPAPAAPAASGDVAPAAQGDAGESAVTDVAVVSAPLTEETAPEQLPATPAALAPPAVPEPPVAPTAPEPPAAAEPADTPRPLHDPDPYSTPPYGEPGPWAPAPPVQHPGATPAQGTPTAPAGPQTPYETTPQPLAPQPLAPHTPAAGAPGSQPQSPAPHTPAAGTAVPQPQPQPQRQPQTLAPHAPAAGAPGSQPQPQPQPQPPAPHTPAAGALGPQPQPHPQPQPQAYPAPAPASAPAPAQPELVPGGGGGVPVGVGPWQQYDPWAGPVSLSQGAGGVGVRPRRGRRGLVLGAVLIALVSGGVGGAVGSYLEQGGGTDVELPQAGAESTHRAPGSVAGIAASALPGVVTIHTKGASEQGTGTGFVLDHRGHILTNNHVVQPAGPGGEISVTFAGGESAAAEVVGHDTGYDLAVIKVDGVRGLKPLPLGNSESVQVGDPVVAIGAPFDLANTVTSGIISAKDRPITAGGEKGDGSDVSYVDALQTDAPINPGNSGGPLVDSKARVIGINSAIRSADSGSELDGGQAGSIGLGFAIPINQAKRVAEELINTGKATHPVIGVTLDMDYTGDGARVGTKGNNGGSAVTPGGPGDKAGIEPRDVITEVDGTPVHSGEELIVKVRAHRPKDKLVITLERGGKERKVTLVLGSADGD